MVDTNRMRASANNFLRHCLALVVFDAADEIDRLRVERDELTEQLRKTTVCRACDGLRADPIQPRNDPKREILRGGIER